jgi:hypothetical protein
VTLSLGSRPFVQHTRPLMAAYAARIGAAFHCVDSKEHVALRAEASAKDAGAMRFLKVPVLAHFLQQYARVLYLDDDVLVGPAMPDLFALVPIWKLGATVERHKPQAWHTMHWRNACSLYGVPDCAARRWQLFNSGVMLLSNRTHGAMLRRGWRADRPRLQCRILCDQLYLNALLKRDGGDALHDLGAAFNYVGSELRRALVTTGGATAASAPASRAQAARRRVGLRDACMLHLTRKVPKLYTADWVARRALSADADVLQCARNASWQPSAAAAEERRRSLLARLPKPLPAGKYAIGAVLCQGETPPCALQPWVGE